LQVLACAGTRPELVKMRPVVEALARLEVSCAVATTGQHQEIADVSWIPVEDHIVLDRSEHSSDLASKVSQMIFEVSKAIEETRPKLILVQGDTASTLAGATASYLCGVPLAHIEAGLRTYSNNDPWPEEGIRRQVSALATYHFAPSEVSVANLLAEKIPQSAIFLTGNTSIDNVREYIRQSGVRVGDSGSEGLIPPTRVPVTIHRREGAGKDRIKALREVFRLSRDSQGLSFEIFLHPNPEFVRDLYDSKILETPNLSFRTPVDHYSFLSILRESAFVISDSGGIQEESPYLGTPVFIARETTERPEIVDQGVAKLVGRDLRLLQHAISDLDEMKKSIVLASSPYGSGDAGVKIAHHVRHFLRETEE